MEFRILGPLEVHDGARVVPLGGVRQRAVLAYLLLHANEVVSRDRLIEELWAGAPPEAAVNVLQTYVSHLRKLLPAGLLETRAPGYLLRLARGELDLHRFEELLERAREALAAGRAEQSARLAHEALALWRGPPLADLADEAFARGPIGRLAELRLVALERRIESNLALGRHLELVGELEGLIAEHPLRERLRGQLMLALYRSGRQAEALEAYRIGRALLVEQLGLEPSRALQQLETAILRQDPALDLAAGERLPAREPAALSAPQRSLLVIPQRAATLGSLLALAEPLARRPPRELILARIVLAERELAEAARLLAQQRAELLARHVAGACQAR